MRFISGHQCKTAHLRHGHARLHALSPEYTAYYGAKRRCTSPKSKSWKDYGGRGIKFLFESFEQFFAELGPRPEGKSLDRIKNNGNYEPGNVRWATKDEQNENKRIAARVPHDELGRFASKRKVFSEQPMATNTVAQLAA